MSEIPRWSMWFTFFAGFAVSAALTQILPSSATVGSAAADEPAAVAVNQDALSSRAPTGNANELRWRVAEARYESGGDNTYCSTAVTATNLTGSTVDIMLEWMNATGSSLGTSTKVAVAAHGHVEWVANNTVESGLPGGGSGLTDFSGHALVYSEDPRIMVSARVYCRDGTGNQANIVSDYMVPTLPVGTTMDFFQAGMPSVWLNTRTVE